MEPRFPVFGHGATKADLGTDSHVPEERSVGTPQTPRFQAEACFPMRFAAVPRLSAS